MSFREHVLKIVHDIPRGQVMSYGQVAKAAGFPGAARAVGSLMKQNHDPNIPCHRVVTSTGNIGEYNREGGSQTKWNRLKAEGVDMSKLRI